MDELSEPRVRYRSPSFVSLSTFEVTVDRRIAESANARFVRGDVDTDGRFLLADAVSLFNHLFRGKEAAACRKAADVNDDGSLNPI